MRSINTEPESTALTAAVEVLKRCWNSACSRIRQGSGYRAQEFTEEKTMQATKLKMVQKAEKLKAPLLDPTFKYINAAATDVQSTWRKFGWTPPSAVKERHEAR